MFRLLTWLFGILHYILIYKKCELSRFIILVLSGFDSHMCQYTQKVHTNRVNIRYITDTYFNLSKIERIPNKANAYLCSAHLRLSFHLTSGSDDRFYAVGGSESLDGNREWIHVLHLTILTKNERLIVATMLFNNFTMVYF